MLGNSGVSFDIAWSPVGVKSGQKLVQQKSAKLEKKRLAMLKKAEPVVIQMRLQDFQSQELLDFGSVPALQDEQEDGYLGEIELINSNREETLEVTLDRFSGKNGFTVVCDENGGETWTIGGGESTRIRIVWKPLSAGGVRQSITFSFLNANRRRVRVGAFLAGVATKAPGVETDSNKKKKPLLRKKGTSSSSTSSHRSSSNNIKRVQPLLDNESVGTAGDENGNIEDMENNSSIQNRVRLQNSNSPGSVLRRKENLSTSSSSSLLASSRAKPSQKPHQQMQAKRKFLPSRKLELRKPAQDKENVTLKTTMKDLKMRRVLYDERWMEKQEKGFANWLNYVMDPDVFSPEGELIEEDDLLNPLASLARKQRHASLQRQAYLTFHSDEMANTSYLLEKEISEGRISIRTDREMFRDLGLRKLVTDLLFRYNGPWLRLGLETVLNCEIPGNRKALKRVINTYILGDPELESRYRESKKGLFAENPEYQLELRRASLYKFLVLVLFLDRAKMASIIDHPSCLFCVDSPIKSSSQMLIMYAKEFLAGEGNVVRHLEHSCGYKVFVQQTALDEFDFKVDNLAVDLRDGVRLTRAVELLTKNKNRTLSQVLRVPAVSRLQKLHNVDVALNELAQHDVDLEYNGDSTKTFVKPATKSMITKKDIVDGHRGRTLALLWKMIAKWKLSVIVSETILRDEINRVRALHGATASQILEKSLAQQKQQQVSHDSLEDDRQMAIENLLLEWCQVICAHHGMRISNITTSMATGRALCLLVHHYHPKLLQVESIAPTSVELSNGGYHECEPDLDWVPYEAHNMTRAEYKKAMMNEQTNFRLVNDCVNALGCIPVLLPTFDSENVPERKMMLLFLAYLSSRLLESRDYINAAIKIQRAWLRRRRMERMLANKELYESASVTIQMFYRDYRLRKEQRIDRAALVLTSACRSWLTSLQERRVTNAARKIQAVVRGENIRRLFLQIRGMVVLCQSIVRRRLAINRVKTIKVLQHHSAVKIQSFVRGTVLVRRGFIQLLENAVMMQCFVRQVLAQTAFERKKNAVLVIQNFVRVSKAKRLAGHMIESIVKVQALGRRWLQRIKLEREQVAAVKCQAFFRQRTERIRYLAQVRAATVITNMCRMFLARRQYRKAIAAVIKIQALVRQDCLRIRFLGIRLQVVFLQSKFRETIARRNYLACRTGFVSMQAVGRGHLARKSWTKVSTSVLVIQRLIRGRLVQRRFQDNRNNIVASQASIRGFLARKRFTRAIEATVRVQTFLRMQRARHLFAAKRASAIKIAQRVRGWKQQSHFKNLKRDVVVIQAAWRMRSANVQFQTQRASAVRIQAFARKSMMLHRFVTAKHGIVALQALARRSRMRKEFVGVVHQATAVQAFGRSVIVRMRYVKTRTAATKIQSMYRGYKMKQAFLANFSNVVKAQTIVRRWLATRQFRATVTNVVSLQAFCRGRMIRLSYVAARKSVVSLQAFARMSLSRSAFAKNKTSAVRIQILVRQYIATRQYQMMRTSATKIQAFYRGMEIANQYGYARAATILVQTMVRRRLVLNAFQRQRVGFTLLQARCRGMIGRKQFQVLKASVRVQSVARQFLARVRYERIRRSVVVIQAFWRGREVASDYCSAKQKTVVAQSVIRKYLAARKYNEFKRKTIVLQSHVRMWQGRAKFEKACAKIVGIQSFVRGYLGRSKFEKIVSQVVLIQRTMRLASARLKYLDLLRKATLVQAFWRGTAARKVKQQRLSGVVVLQTKFRQYLTRARFEKAVASVCHIQRLVRGSIVRQRVGREKRSIVMIQSFIRGHNARTEANIKRLVIVRLQAFSRGACTRSALQRERDNAVRIQAFWKAARVQLALRRQADAVSKIQSTWRAMMVRRDFLFCKYNVIIAQSVVRQYLERKKFVAYVRGVIRIQRFVKAKCLEAVQQQVVAKKFQALYRGYRVRKALSRKIREMKRRIEAANARAREEDTLANRTKSALDWLLRTRNLANVLKACQTLQVSTLLSRECSESFLNTDASEVLFALIRSCNRSEPHQRVLQVALTVLVQVARQDETRGYSRLFAVPGEGILSIVDLLQIFRDKNKIFSRALELLGYFCSDENRVYNYIIMDRDLRKRIVQIEQIMRKKRDITKQNRQIMSRTTLTKSAANAKELSEKRQYQQLRHLLQQFSEFDEESHL